MTSGVGGSQNYESQQLQQAQQQIIQQGAPGSHGADKGHETRNSTSLSKLTENAASGLEEMISEGQVGKASKKDQLAETTKASKKNPAGGKDNVQKSTDVATAQAIQGPQGTRANSYELPTLPEPTANINGIQLKKNMGTLSLLGLVMTLLAQANAKSWSADFAQQNQAIQNQVQMAPEIGQAIRTQAEHQSAATQAQATQSLVSGITNIASFAISAGVGVFSAVGSSGGIKSASFASETAENAGGAASGAASGMSNITKNAANSMDDIAAATGKTMEQGISKATSGSANITQGTSGVLGKTTSTLGTTKESLTGVVDDVINNPAWKEKLSRGMNVLKEQGGRAARFAGESFNKAMQVAQTMNLISQGVDGIAGFIYGSQAAAHQKQAGIAEAQAAELQQMASVMDKYASQAQSLGDQSHSSFQSALQLLQNAADSMTQTSASIFS